MASTTRERLIEAAQTEFYQGGFQAVGLDAILRVVGVTKTTFYKHFESKDDLIVAVDDQQAIGVEQAASAILDAIDEKSWCKITVLRKGDLVTVEFAHGEIAGEDAP